MCFDIREGWLPFKLKYFIKLSSFFCFRNQRLFSGEIKSSLHDEKCVFVNGFNLKLSSSSFFFRLFFSLLVLYFHYIHFTVIVIEIIITICKLSPFFSVFHFLESGPHQRRKFFLKNKNFNNGLLLRKAFKESRNNKRYWKGSWTAKLSGFWKVWPSLKIFFIREGENLY